VRLSRQLETEREERSEGNVTRRKCSPDSGGRVAYEDTYLPSKNKSLKAGASGSRASDPLIHRIFRIRNLVQCSLSSGFGGTQFKDSICSWNRNMELEEGASSDVTSKVFSINYFSTILR
jgi:hypothetical protein